MKEEEMTFYNYKSDGGEQFVGIEFKIKGSLIICSINFPSLDVDLGLQFLFWFHIHV